MVCVTKKLTDNACQEGGRRELRFQKSGSWSGERAGEAEREGVGALRGPACVSCWKREAAELFLTVEVRPRTRARRRRAQEESSMSGGAAGWETVKVGGKREPVLRAKASFAR